MAAAGTMAPYLVKGGSSGYDTDMQEFLLNLEVSAKRILKNEAKKRIAEAKRQQLVAMNPALASKLANNNIVQHSSPSCSPSRKRPLGAKGAIILVPPESLSTVSVDGRRADFSGMEPMAFNEQEMSVSVSKLGPGQKTFVSTPFAAPLPGGVDPMKLDTKPPWQHEGVYIAGSTETRLPHLGAKSQQIRRQLEEVMAMGAAGVREKILPVLFKNPLYRPSDNQRKQRTILADAKVTASCDASKSMSSAIKPRKERRTEIQGPMSWTSDDLRIKYRSESAREQAWVASKAAQAAAEHLLATEGVVVPFPVVERHPIHVQFYMLVKAEYRMAADRARARNRMRRFVSDVHTVWLTNLAALREHSLQRHEAAPCSDGLQGRRDVGAILSLSSQIQSVSKSCAIRSAAYPTHESPPVLASSSPFTRAPPSLTPPLRPPPRLWCLLDQEPVTIRSIRRQYRCCIHRLAQVGKESEGALWRLCMYDVADGCELTMVMAEDDAVKSVQRNILRSTERQGFADEAEMRKAWVHKQARRLPLAGHNAVPTFVTICVYAGPHDMVLAEITAFPVTVGSTTRQTLRVTTHEIIARLELKDLPAAELKWWQASRTPELREKLWQPLTGLLKYVGDGSAPGRLALEDQEVRDREGFDVYGMLATAHAMVPLIRVTGQQQQKGTNFITTYSLSIPDVLPARLREHDIQWEDEADFNMPLTLRVSGKLAQLQQVHGVAVWGRLGLWYLSPHPQGTIERTQPVACFFRERNMSSTDSVLAMVLLALDTPCMTPSVVAWEHGSVVPPSPPDEEPDGVVPAIISDPITHLRTPMVSSCDEKRACTVVLLTAAEAPEDYTPADAVHAARQGSHRRLTPERDEDGFGQHVTWRLLVPSNDIPTHIYGISGRGATPNVTRANGRYIWHSEQCCHEEIVRRRTAKDYAYILRRKVDRGLNETQIFTVYTRRGRFHSLVRGGFKQLMKEYEEMKRREEKKRKEQALKLKMEAAESKLAEDKKAQELLDAGARAKEMKTVMKMGAKRERTSLARWHKRFAHSEVLATRDGWEKRKHHPSGNIFYHNGDPNDVRGFSHDPASQEWVNEEATDSTMVQLVPSTEPTARAAATGESLATPVAPESRNDDGADGEQILSITNEAAAPAPAAAPLKELESAERTHEKRIEQILNDLSTNPVLINSLADRLGAAAFVPLHKRDQSVEPMERELDDDERAWSDSDDETGDDVYDKGFLCQDWAEQYQEQKADSSLFAKNQPKPKTDRPGIVPMLPIKARLPQPATELEVHAMGQGWRRLPRPELKSGFITSMLRRRTEGPSRNKDLNRPPRPRIIGAQDTTEAGIVAHGDWSYTYKPETRYITDVMTDVQLKVDMVQGALAREERLAKAGGLSQIVASGGLDAVADQGAMVVSEKARDQGEEADRAYEVERRALAAVAAGDFEHLETAVDDDNVNVNCIDDHGNTLIIKAAQQGSKKMVKFLLKRGANIDAQNFRGETALHYAYAYNYRDLGQYLEEKGANSTILNADGLTPYEGLRREAIESL